MLNRRREATVTTSPETKRVWLFWIRGLAILLTAAFVSNFLHEHKAFQRIDHFNLDWLIAAKRPVKDDSIFLIKVDDNDYEKFFMSQSPLEPEMIIQLIKAIAPSKPSVIGIDLDTGSWTSEQRSEATATSVPIVWAIEPTVHYSAWGQFSLELPASSSGGRSAIPGFLPDEDGLVRRYYREVPADSTLGEGKRNVTYQSFVTAVNSISSGSLRHTSNTAENEPTNNSELARIINFTGSRFDGYSASQVWTLSQDAHNSSSLQQFPEMSGKIVLIGGTFTKGRDSYATPAGFKPGLEIIAEALHSEKDPIREGTEKDIFMSDLLFGLALLLLNFFASRKIPGITAKAAMIVVEFCCMPIIMLLMTWAAFEQWRFYASFLILTAGMFIHAFIEFQYEQREEISELKREIEHLKKRHSER